MFHHESEVKMKTFIAVILAAAALLQAADKQPADDGNITERQVRKQQELEKKYAEEQKFYQGDDYDLKRHEVNPESLPDVPVIKPEYDFDMTHVYD